ncbi:MAG: hypothetical protein MRY64_08455 [Hyphomonadaceae bacterium]|nr:hypothetical protein [Hyphomonadaceae bacterium]
MSWRIAPMVMADGAEAQPISLVPTTPRPMGHLAQLDSMFDVSATPSRGELTLAAAALPAPGAYPQLRVTSPAEPVRVMVNAPAPPPASAKPPIVMAKADAAFPPMPDAAAQAALRNMLCNRMSAHEDAACVAPEPAPSEPQMVLASAERRYVSAEMTLETRSAEPSFYSDPAWREEVRDGQVRFTPASRRMATVARPVRERPTVAPTPRIRTAQVNGPAPIVYR